MPANSEISVAIFINPLAGDGRFVAVENAIMDELKHNAIGFVKFRLNWPDSLPSCTHLFLVGGDGTINFFINKYPACKIPISVFKSGTGNDFAWKLYGDRPISEQIQKGIHGNEHAIDAGTCNGKLFINGLGIGFDGAVVKDMRSSVKMFTGWLAYYFSVIKVINGYRSKQLNIHGVAQKSTGRTFMITIANGSRFGGNFMVAPEASLNDGLLDLMVISQVAVWQRYQYLPRMKKGRHLSLPFVKADKISSIKITAVEPVAAHLDGELLITDSFEIGILKGRFNFRY